MLYLVHIQKFLKGIGGLKVRPRPLSWISFTALLSLALNLGGIEPSPAKNNLSCQGESCTEQSPGPYGCLADATVLAEIRQTITRPQDDWQRQEIIVQKLYSETCQASWTKAYIPDTTFLFVRIRGSDNELENVRGMIQADGEDYFWTQSRMSDGNLASQACVSIPILSVGIGHDIYNQYCTEFN
ncbi:hypothetical protein NDI52_30675 [Leptolyngbya sp. PL-A3]